MEDALLQSNEQMEEAESQLQAYDMAGPEFHHIVRVYQTLLKHIDDVRQDIERLQH